jgi:hypothetical protein
MFKDSYDVNKNIFEGVLKCVDLSSGQTLFEEHNQIVVDSGLILREFLANNADAEGIKYISFGDMQMDPSKNVRDVRPPLFDDWKLDNEVFRKEVEIKKVEDVYGYGVEYSVVIEKDEMNGSTGEQLITEYGLLSGSIHTDNIEKLNTNMMFSRKTRAGIFKDYEMRLKFIWTIYFVKNIKIETA